VLDFGAGVENVAVGPDTPVCGFGPVETTTVVSELHVALEPL
jgi:hypothetical protein